MGNTNILQRAKIYASHSRTNFFGWVVIFRSTDSGGGGVGLKFDDL